jgi:tetratricopeptide (TPR) repeat protein
LSARKTSGGEGARARCYPRRHRHGEASTWDSVGYAHHQAGNYTRAADCYQQALALFRELADRYAEADVLANLGDTHHAAGNQPAARTAWRHALDILNDLDHSDGDVDTIHAKLHALTPGCHAEGLPDQPSVPGQSTCKDIDRN